MRRFESCRGRQDTPQVARIFSYKLERPGDRRFVPGYTTGTHQKRFRAQTVPVSQLVRPEWPPSSRPSSARVRGRRWLPNSGSPRLRRNALPPNRSAAGPSPHPCPDRRPAPTPHSRPPTDPPPAAPPGRRNPVAVGDPGALGQVIVIRPAPTGLQIRPGRRTRTAVHVHPTVQFPTPTINNKQWVTPETPRHFRSPPLVTYVPQNVNSWQLLDRHSGCPW